MDPDEGSPLALNHTKGRRGPVSSSCAECKRLKIRCTGTTEPFPCASCVKRGVSAICPNGVMNGRTKRDAGDSDVLRRRNQALSARVKELEIELAKAKATSGVSPSASDRRTDDEETVYNNEENLLIETFGTLTIEDTGRTIWHGPYTPTINLLAADDPGNGSAPHEHIYDESLPPELAVLAAAFPLTAGVGVMGLKDGIRALSPSYDEAVDLAECFFTYASWLGSPCTRERFMLTILMPLYASKSWELERADVMALFFGILSVGAMFDCSRPQYDPIAFRMHKLCAVSLALAKPLDRPTVTALEAMQTHLFFHQLSDTPSAIARFWTLAGVAFRMVLALGLHRDSRTWGLDPELEERRRWLFWQLNFMDAVISAAYGRPRFFNPRHYDCPLPDEKNRPELKGIAAVRFRFLREAFIPVLEDAFSVTPPPTYATIMRLDTRICDLPTLNPEALGLDVMSMTSGECMQVFCVGGMKQLVLLYLHRRFLFEAVSDDQCTDISTHKYAYSVNAGLKAAISMTRQTRGEPFVLPMRLDADFPSPDLRLVLERPKDVIQTFLPLATRVFSAVFAALVIKRPQCEHAETAMNEMDSLLAVFEQAKVSRRVRRCLPTMLSLREKASAILGLYRAGRTFKVPIDNQLERLIGGTPVVFKVSEKSAGAGAFPTAAVPTEPVIQKKTMEFDLQALFGAGIHPSDSVNDIFINPVPPFQPDLSPFQWNAPLNSLNTADTNGMTELDQVLYSYLNVHQGMLDLAGTPNWDSLMQEF